MYAEAVAQVNEGAPLVGVLIGVGVSLAIAVAIAVCFGNATKKMNAQKGYDGGFWWGFFLGVLGLIVIAVRPFNLNNPKYAPYRPNHNMQ